MKYYIVEFSKYVIPFFMVLYTVESIFALFKKAEDGRNGVYVRQGVYIFLIQFVAYLCLCLMTGQIEYLFFYAFLQIALFSTLVLHQMLYPKSQRLLLNHMCLLISIGFIILTRLDFDKAVKQFMIVAATLVLSLILPFFIHKMRFMKYLKWLYALVGIAGLSVVLILGQVTHGAKISYTIAQVTVQPSEFVKIIFVFLIASVLYKSASFKNVMVSAVLSAIHILILVASKDLGSSLIFFMGYLFMLLIATGNYFYLLLGFCSGSGAAVLGYLLFSHVRVRVQAFLNPFSVIDNQGYQMSQSLFAISHGKWFGTGLFQGTPSDIPFVESDFIFSAIAEELGGIFAVCLILICLLCFLVFLKIAMELYDPFYRLIAAGMGVMYIFQVFLTIGGGIKFIPLTGVTLPLVSYGGSSVLTTLLMFSIMQGLHMIHFTEIKQAKNSKKKKRYLWKNNEEQDDIGETLLKEGEEDAYLEEE